jgi:NACalpha-BTF3-like transcription factor
MHPVIIRNIIKYLKLNPPNFINWEIHVFGALSNTNVVGPKSLAIYLKNVLGSEPQNAIDKINFAIKQVDAVDSFLNLDIAIIRSQTSTSYDEARSSYLKHNGDIVESILDLTKQLETQNEVKQKQENPDIYADMPGLEPCSPSRINDCQFYESDVGSYDGSDLGSDVNF